MLNKRHIIIAWPTSHFASLSVCAPQFTSCISLPQQLLLFPILSLLYQMRVCLSACIGNCLTKCFLFLFLSLFHPFGFRSTCFASFVCLFISAEPSVFQAQPPTPPSAAQEATQSPIESSPFLHSVKRLFLNVNYILLLISYGMNVGVFYAISTLLNRVSMQILDKNLWKRTPFTWSIAIWTLTHIHTHTHANTHNLIHIFKCGLCVHTVVVMRLWHVYEPI